MYTTEISLNEDEKPAKINADGEVIVIDGFKTGKKSKKVIKTNIPTPFNKSYKVGWEWLFTQTNKRQYAIAQYMSTMIVATTNSLSPLNDKTSNKELAKMLNASEKTIRKDVDYLFSKGVFGKFEVYDSDNRHTYFWVFNPYLTSNGAWLNKATEDLFSSTMIAKLVRAEENFKNSK